MTTEDDINYFLHIKHIAQHYKQIINELANRFSSEKDAIKQISLDVKKELLKSS
jgi:hypothetical protein